MSSKKQIDNGQRAWLPVAIPIELSIANPAEVLAICSQDLTIRLAPLSEGGGAAVLEVFCLAGEEHARATALVQRAAADQALRHQIRDRSDHTISSLVDGVLSRARGG
jgi:hypothetical protein